LIFSTAVENLFFNSSGTLSAPLSPPSFHAEGGLLTLLAIACVVLARCLHEAPVYHGALMQDQVVLLQAVCMLVWSDSLSFLICGKYTNNSLNDNGLREIFTIKSSFVAS
jgi:hypothetical protein